MKCPQCGKNSNVTIGSRIYCTSCGAVIQNNEPKAPNKPAEPPKTPETPKEPVAAELPAAETQPAQTADAPSAPSGSSAPRRMDIAAPGGPKPAAPTAPVTPADRPVVTPLTQTRTMQDVMRPAAAYHNPAPAPVTPSAPEPQAATPVVTPESPAPTPAPVPVAAGPAPVSPDPAPAGKIATRLEAAQAVTKSESIVKFHDPLTSAETIQPAAQAPEPVSPPVAPVTETAAVPVQTEPTPVQAPSAPAAAAVTPPPAASAAQAAVAAALAEIQAAPSPQEMPAPAVTQHEAMQGLTSKEDAFKLAMEAATAATAKPNPLAVGAAALAVVAMGGYIWMQNYPRMQLSAIAGKSGFTATLPGYLPSSYKLSGPVQAQAGQVNLNYTAPGLPNLGISQRLTSWDSSSLAANFVAVKDPKFTTVQGQGLTVYLFGNGQATWVNHGIWYSVIGAAKLSRDQLLKLAGSL